MNWLDIENTAEKWENTVLISIGFYFEGRPIFSEYEYRCHSNTALDKIVVNCKNLGDLPHKKIKRPEEATKDCYNSFQVTKGFTEIECMYILFVNFCVNIPSVCCVLGNKLSSTFP